VHVLTVEPPWNTRGDVWYAGPVDIPSVHRWDPLSSLPVKPKGLNLITLIPMGISLSHGGEIFLEKVSRRL